MNLHVTIELGFLREGLHALRATERSFSRMNAFVGGQMAFFGETLFADGTFERPRTGASQFQAIALKCLRAAFGAIGRVIINDGVDVLVHVSVLV